MNLVPPGYVEGLKRRKKEILRKKMPELFGSDSEDQLGERATVLQICPSEKCELDAMASP